MSTVIRYTSADLALMPDDGKRYVIIEGELYVSRQPDFEHQYTCSQLNYFLEDWNQRQRLGLVVQVPGLVFAEDDHGQILGVRALQRGAGCDLD